ncbi:MAG: ABC transporter substrate-binding protein [Chloroflexota bacterium]
MESHRTKWALVSGLIILGMLLASCAPAAAPTPTAKPAAPAPTKPAAPAATPKPAAEQPKLGGTLTIATTGDPPSFDIQTESSNVVLYPFAPCYNLIVREDPLKPGEIAPDLAEKWELSKDGKTYTFQLRKGVKFHDGKPFTAKDAVFSLERMADKATHLNFVLGPVIKKATAVDDNTLRVDMNFPYSQLINFLALNWAVIMPEHVVKEKGDMKKTAIGTGAFKFKGYQSGVSVELVKNQDYFLKGKPYLDAVTLYPIKDASLRLAGFRTKKIVYMASLTLTSASSQTIKKELADQISVHQHVGSYWFNFYMPNDRSPWNDIRVRRAVFLTIDRQKSLQTVDQGFGRVGTFTPPEMGGKTDEQVKTIPGFRQPKDADIAEAKKLMAAAGYADGFKTEALHRKGRAYEDAAVFVKAQLKEIGIDVEVYTKEDAAFYDTVYKRGYQSHVHRHPMEVDDADSLVPQYFKTGGDRNFGVISDPKIDALIEKQMQTLDPKARMALLQELDNYLIEQAVQVTLHWGGYWIGWWNFLKGFTAPKGHYNDKNWDHAWLAQ